MSTAPAVRSAHHHPIPPTVAPATGTVPAGSAAAPTGGPGSRAIPAVAGLRLGSRREPHREPDAEGSQTGSQQPRTRGHAEPRPAIICPVQRHIRPAAARPPGGGRARLLCDESGKRSYCVRNAGDRDETSGLRQVCLRRHYRVTAMLTVARVPPLDPSIAPTVLVLTLDLDVLTDTRHCPSPCLDKRPTRPAISGVR